MREAGEIGCPSSSRAYSARAPPRMRLAWIVRSPEPDLDDGKRSVVSPPNARAPRRRYGVAAAVERGGPKLASLFFWDAFFPESTVDSDPVLGSTPWNFWEFGPHQKRTVQGRSTSSQCCRNLDKDSQADCYLRAFVKLGCVAGKDR